MGFNPPVPQRDSDWEIRTVVLLSLDLQVLLIFLAPMRKRSTNPLLCSAVWACYLLADWVADLGLGLLLNNLGNIGGNGSSNSNSLSSGTLKHGFAGNANAAQQQGSSPVIFAFWTPFLLLHLGGPDTITAYSIDDNELWLRHLVGLLFEVFSALVVFFCSLKTNPVIPATVLMFVMAIIKYGERTYSLYSGSVDGILGNILEDPNPGPNYAKLMTEFDSREKAGLVVEIMISDKKQAHQPDQHDHMSLVARAYGFFLTFRRSCFDIILSYKERKASQAYFLNGRMSVEEAIEVIEVELNFIYDMVHTKALVAHSKVGCALRFVASTCIVSSLVVFFRLDKGSIHRVDVGVTYALLLGGLGLDATALAMLISSNWTLVFLEHQHTKSTGLAATVIRLLRPQPQGWSERTLQINLIGYCLNKLNADDQGRWWSLRPRAIRAMAKVADALGVRETLDDFFFIRRQPVMWSRRQGRGAKKDEDVDLIKFVFKKAMEVKDARYEEMRKVFICRGEGILREKSDTIREKMKNNSTIKDLCVRNENLIDKMVEENLAVIHGSVGSKRDFDDSLLLWHIATDLCNQDGTTPATTGDQDMNGAGSRTQEQYEKIISKTLSEYMMYLLAKMPKMLSSTAGIGLLRYRDTRAEAQRFFESVAHLDPDHGEARKMLLNVNTSKKPREVKGDRSKSVLFDACILAKALNHLDDDTKWEVIAGVWMEMLIYVATKCRGSTHVRQLSRGGEFLTTVWLLMAHLGIGDVYQIEEVYATGRLIIHDQ